MRSKIINSQTTIPKPEWDKRWWGRRFKSSCRTRCAACHQNNNLTQVRTFAIALPPHPPRVKQLNPSANAEADFDMTMKKKRKDFSRSLLVYFK